MKNLALQQLLQTRSDLWRGSQHPLRLQCFPSGFDELDKHLGGGWPVGTLTELMHDDEGIGELSLLLPLLACRTQQQATHVALVNPPYAPYAPALASAGVALEHLLIVETDEHCLWSTEQLLKSGLVDVVIFWQAKTDNRSQRRLQLAAEAGQALAINYRPLHAAQSHSAAALRITLQAKNTALQLCIIKSRSNSRQQDLTISRQRLFRASRPD